MIFGLILAWALAANAATPQPAHDHAHEQAKALTATVGACECTLDPLAREASDHPLGKSPVRDVRGQMMSISVVNDEMALRIFQEMTVQKKIPFGFPEDGCYARAHEMSMLLEKEGVITGKVFATGEFQIANEKAAHGRVTWGFHVAPFLIVDRGEGREIWVIDPSLFYEPVTLDAWLMALTAHPKSKLKSVFLTNRFIYRPHQKDRIRTAYDPRDLKDTRRIMKRYLKTETKRERATAPDL